MKLNCKAGDLAVIIKSWNGNEGKIVTCIRFVGKVEGWDGDDYWEVDRLLQSNKGNSKPYFFDSFMRPLRDNPGQDETLSWCDVPSKEHA